jgi:hypothetical protein
MLAALRAVQCGLTYRHLESMLAKPNESIHVLTAAILLQARARDEWVLKQAGSGFRDSTYICFVLDGSSLVYWCCSDCMPCKT